MIFHKNKVQNPNQYKLFRNRLLIRLNYFCLLHTLNFSCFFLLLRSKIIKDLFLSPPQADANIPAQV